MTGDDVIRSLERRVREGDPQARAFLAAEFMRRKQGMIFLWVQEPYREPFVFSQVPALVTWDPNSVERFAHQHIAATRASHPSFLAIKTNVQFGGEVRLFMASTTDTAVREVPILVDRLGYITACLSLAEAVDVPNFGPVGAPYCVIDLARNRAFSIVHSGKPPAIEF